MPPEKEHREYWFEFFYDLVLAAALASMHDAFLKNFSIQTALVTGSFVLAGLCYIGAGMAVLTALLVSEMLFPPMDANVTGDEAARAGDTRA